MILLPRAILAIPLSSVLLGPSTPAPGEGRDATAAAPRATIERPAPARDARKALPAPASPGAPARR